MIYYQGQFSDEVHSAVTCDQIIGSSGPIQAGIANSVVTIIMVMMIIG